MKKLLRPRFSLWAMLVVITVVAIPLAYVAQRRSFNLRRKAAYALLVAKGAEIVTPESEDDTPEDESALVPNWFQKWLKNILLEDISPQVEQVNCRIFPENQPNAPLLSDTDLEQLVYFPEVKDVELHWCGEAPSTHSIEGAFLGKLKGDSLLRSLYILNLDSFDGRHLEALVNFPKFESLSIQRCLKINDETLSRVELPSSLTSLHLHKSSVGDETLIRWLVSRRFESLEIDANISGRVAPALAKQTSLASLKIFNAPLFDDDFKFLAKCSLLRDFTLTSMPIRGAFLKDLPSESAIDCVNLSHTLLTDENAAELGRLSHLHYLYLSYTPLTGEFAKVNPTWPEMRIFDLRGARFSDEGKLALAQLKLPAPQTALPHNWTLKDFEGFPIVKDGLSRVTVPEHLFGPGLPKEVGWHSNALSGSEVDRCPADLMAPVIRLQELAEAEVKEIRQKEKRNGGGRWEIE